MKESLFQKYRIIEFTNFEPKKNADINAPVEIDEVLYTYHFGVGCYRNVLERRKGGEVGGLVARRVSEDVFVNAYYAHIKSGISPIVLK